MKRTRLRLYVLGMCLCVVIAVVLFVRLSHFNPVTGVYSYDPRQDQPSNFFLANRPDVVLVAALNKQIERDGTFPPDAAAKVVLITPLNVDISTYTDWQAYAFVQTRLDYADGSARVENFRFHSGGSQGMFWPLSPAGEITYHAIYGRLTGCGEMTDEPPGQAVCGLD